MSEMTTKMPAVIWTAGEMAKQLKLDHSMICRYCRQGRIKAIRPGSEWLISQEEFERFASTPRPYGNPMFRDRAKRRRKGTRVRDIADRVVAKRGGISGTVSPSETRGTTSTSQSESDRIAMADLADLDLDNLTPDDLPRVLAAVKRVKGEMTKANRRASIERARVAQAAIRAELAKQGKKLPYRHNMTKGELEQRNRKAADTRRKNRNLPTECEVCGGVAAYNGLCQRHWKAWRRSGVPREEFVEWYDSGRRAQGAGGIQA